MQPYTEVRIDDKSVIRTFPGGLPQEALRWHQDAVDRLTTPLATNDWSFQLDDELPVPLDREIFVPNHVWHRVIPGSTELRIRIDDC